MTRSDPATYIAKGRPPKLYSQTPDHQWEGHDLGRINLSGLKTYHVQPCIFLITWSGVCYTGIALSFSKVLKISTWRTPCRELYAFLVVILDQFHGWRIPLLTHHKGEIAWLFTRNTLYPRLFEAPFVAHFCRRENSMFTSGCTDCQNCDMHSISVRSFSDLSFPMFYIPSSLLIEVTWKNLPSLQFPDVFRSPGHLYSVSGPLATDPSR